MNEQAQKSEIDRKLKTLKLKSAVRRGHLQKEFKKSYKSKKNKQKIAEIRRKKVKELK